MRPFEVDDISSADMAKVQTLTAEYIAESGGGSQSSASETVLAQDLHAVLRPYNEFSRSLMMKVRLSGRHQPRASAPSLLSPLGTVRPG